MYEISFKRFCCLVALLSILAMPNSRVHATVFSPADGLIGGVTVGKAYFTDRYGACLEGRGAFGVDISHSLPFGGLPLLLECGFTALDGRMKESSSSRFSARILHLGVIGYYPFHRRLHPFAGIILQESYMTLNTSNMNENDSSFRPGAGLKLGFLTPLTPHFGLRAFFDYRNTPMSSGLLGSSALGLAAVARLPCGDLSWASDRREYHAEKMREQADRLVSRGMEELERGDVADAKGWFTRAVYVDPENTRAISMLAEIKSAESAYGLASRLIKEKRYYEAIPQLEKSMPVYADAKRKLSKIRSMLAPEVPIFEKKGIEAYEAHRYEECIAIMKKIRLVDPDNHTARLYLPRAEGRMRAIERLR